MLKPSDLCKWEETRDGRLLIPKGEGYVTGFTTLGATPYTFVSTAKGEAFMIPSEFVKER